MNRYSYLSSEFQGRDPDEENIVDLICALTKREILGILVVVLCVLAVGMLGGCATSYWQPNPAFSDFEPVNIRIAYTDDLSPCASSVPILGCAVRIKESRQCFVYVNASRSRDMRRCVAMHEARHCIAGEDHEIGRPNYAIDCGNGSVR